MQMPEVFFYSVKIPKERIGVLIGKDGAIKKQIESATETKLEIDQKEGDVKITGADTIKVFNAQEIIKAISYGFSAENALLLLRPDFMLDVIELTETNPIALRRLKGKVIGEKGKSRKNLEQLTQAKIAVYGKTIGIIGDFKATTLARKAIEKLLRGSSHGFVYRWIKEQISKRE